MNIDDANVVKIGVVRRRNRIHIGELFTDAEQVALVHRDGHIYIEPADNIVALSRQPVRPHLGRASEILGLKEGDKYVVVKNEKGYVLLKLNISVGGRYEEL